MQLEEIKSALKQILVERLSIDLDEVNATDDTSLFDENGWGIDSVDVLDLVLGIEKKFGIRIEQDEEVKRHFESIQTLSTYIQQQLQAMASA